MVAHTADIDGIAGGAVKGDSNDGVETEAHGALEVVGLAVLDDVRNDEDGDGKGNSLDCRHEVSTSITEKVNSSSKLTGLKAESHGLINDPANNDEEGGDTKSNLDGGANGNVHGKIHLVADGNNNSGDVLSSVSDNGDENQTDECLANVHLLDDVIDAANEVVGANGNQNSNNNQDNAGSKRAHVGFFAFLFLFFSLSGLALGIKKVAVGSELEEEVHGVEHQQDDGSAAGQGEDALSLALGTALVENAIQLRKGVSYLVSITVETKLLTAAGMMREAEDRVMREQVV